MSGLGNGAASTVLLDVLEKPVRFRIAIAGRQVASR
jgi:hypothetical protein